MREHWYLKSIGLRGRYRVPVLSDHRLSFVVTLGRISPMEGAESDRMVQGCSIPSPPHVSYDSGFFGPLWRDLRIIIHCLMRTAMTHHKREAKSIDQTIPLLLVLMSGPIGSVKSVYEPRQCFNQPLASSNGRPNQTIHIQFLIITLVSDQP